MSVCVYIYIYIYTLIVEYIGFDLGSFVLHALFILLANHITLLKIYSQLTDKLYY